MFANSPELDKCNTKSLDDNATGLVEKTPGEVSSDRPTDRGAVPGCFSQLSRWMLSVTPYFYRFYDSPNLYKHNTQSLDQIATGLVEKTPRVKRQAGLPGDKSFLFLAVISVDVGWYPILL